MFIDQQRKQKRAHELGERKPRRITRIARLDPVSLRLVPAAAGDADAPQGASGWPGESVFWVQKEYTTGMACHDAGSGDSVAFYDDVDGPVRSVRGVIYAVSHGAVYRLPATRACPG